MKQTAYFELAGYDYFTWNISTFYFIAENKDTKGTWMLQKKIKCIVSVCYTVA
jgi:hypothetical protein